MSQTNRKSLNAAWVRHWDVLFPDYLNREKTLQQWLAFNALNFEPTKPLLTLPYNDQPILPEFVKFTFELNAKNSNIIFDGHEVASVSWFNNTLSSVRPQWVPGHSDHINPIKKLNECVAQDQNFKYYKKECADLFQSIALRIGQHIENEFRFKIRIGHLKASALQLNSSAEISGEAIVKLLNVGHRLNIWNNSLCSANGLDVATHLEITKGPFSSATGNLPKSFDNYDQAIFERMEALISSGAVPSVLQAAKFMASWAPRKGTIESVERRLEAGYNN